MVSQLQRKLDGKPARAGAVSEQFGCPGDTLEDGVAVGVQACGGARGVFGFLEEHPQCLAETRRTGRVRSERTQRRGDEFGRPIQVPSGQRGDFELAVERDAVAAALPAEQAVHGQCRVV